MKKTFLYASAIALAFSSGPAKAEDVNERVNRLEREIQFLKQQLEANNKKTAEATAAANAASAKAAEKTAATNSPNVEFGSKGLVISSPDKSAQLSLRGSAQFDYRAFINDEDHNQRNEFLSRRIRPQIEAKYGDASLRIIPDFAGSSTKIMDAHIDYKLYDELQFRIGKFKPPVSLERLQSANDTFFNERGHPSNLAPSRDIGAQIYGELIPGQLEYQFAFMNGNEDLGNTDNDSDDKKDYIARIFAHPFAHSDIEELQGLGVGIAGSIGQRDGNAGTSILTDGYRTPGQQRFFRYNAGTFADGTNWRLYPQAYWYSDNFGLIAEYAYSSQEVTNGANSTRLGHNAWQVAGSIVLTGEDVNFRGSVKPSEDFDIRSGSLGAFELVGRYGETNIDEDAFPIFANAAASASKAQSAGIGLNWYLNQNAKLAFDYDHSWFDDGSATGDRPNEDVIISRVQYRF